MDINDPQAAVFLNKYIESVIDKKNKKRDKRLSATVVGISAGTVTVNFPNETIDINISNPNEVPCEIGDQIGIICIRGDLSNSIVEYRKAIMLDTVFVRSDGTDEYGRDSSCKQYGSIEAPFKTPEYALSRLPKNLNNRKIRIYLMDVGYGRVIDMGGFHSGTLIISGYSGYSSQFLGMSFEHCTAEMVFENLWSLGGISDSGSIFDFYNCSNVTIKGCEMFVDPTVQHGSYCIKARRSSVRVENCVGSDPDDSVRIGTFIHASDMSNILCKNNTGGGLNLLYSISEDSTLGVLGTEPTGVTRASIDASSVIRP